MKNLFLRLKGRIITVNKWLGFCFLIAFASVLLIDLWLVKLPEWFTNASVIGTIYRNLCFAYMTSFIFYFLNVHLQNYKTKVKTFGYLENKLSRLQQLSVDLIILLKKAAGEPRRSHENLLTKDEVKEYCKKVNPNPTNSISYTWSNLSFLNWYELFEFIETETKDIFRDLSTIKESLDTEIITRLANIEKVAESGLNKTRGKVLGNTTLELFATEIYEYRNQCEEILVYFHQEYEIYEDEYAREYDPKYNSEKAKKEQENEH
ncbi:hypothetical protein [Priestia megaterium]|uniref:hypothetical protein n=1 Tax=Priestia megaterium TaxID=1404 RepID=UPI0012B9877E|nr:hypothetical protein [Priestia megaterium]